MILSPVTVYDLSGRWSVSTSEQKVFHMTLPGTLDEYNIGLGELDVDAGEKRDIRLEAEVNPLDPNFDIIASDYADAAFELDRKEPIRTRFTRRHAYCGEARIYRLFTFEEHPGKRLFLEIERARDLRLFIDGEEIPYYEEPTLVSPAVFEVTGKIGGSHLLTIISSNDYVDEFKEEFLASNMASDDTQTNWNGLLGYVRLREENETFLSDIQLTISENREMTVTLEITSTKEATHSLSISANALENGIDREIMTAEGVKTLSITGLKLKASAKRWDENEGNLHELRVFLDKKLQTVDFGIRDFSVSSEGLLQLNGRRIFLRGETNEAVFPETGYLPTDIGTWEKIFKCYRSYGVNFVYFHGCCPTDAAFTAADGLGMLLCPEISISHSVSTLTSKNLRLYYKNECDAILRNYGSHPSFVMLGLGQEKKEREDFSQAVLDAYLTVLSKKDPTKLYITAGRIFTGKGVGARMAKIRFFAGQHEFPPDFREIDLFSGFCLPENLCVMKETAEQQKLLPYWDKYAAAGGGQALTLYRRDAENAYREDRFSGIVLSGLQDMPGFGTHLYGMLNSHLVPKHYDYSDARKFAAFFGPVVPMAVFSAPVYEAGETITARVSLSNFGKSPVKGALSYTVTLCEKTVEQAFEASEYPEGSVSTVGTLTVPGEILKALPDGECGLLSVTLRFGILENRYDVPIVPAVSPKKPAGITECSYPDESIFLALGQGNDVLLMPKTPAKAADLPMTGVDLHHPLLSKLPLQPGNSLFFERLLTQEPAPLDRKTRIPLFRVSFEDGSKIHGYFAEFRCRNGNVFLSTIPLRAHQDKPEGRALLAAIYDYMTSLDFSPSCEIRPDDLKQTIISLEEKALG